MFEIEMLNTTLFHNRKEEKFVEKKKTKTVPPFVMKSANPRSYGDYARVIYLNATQLKKKLSNMT